MLDGSKEDLLELRKRMEELKPWYHNIDLGNGLVTPGLAMDKVWNNIKGVIKDLDYSGKDVLDLGSWDGMWAFEAEKRGAKTVVASDTRVQGHENLLFAKYVLKSKVFPLFNAPVQSLVERIRIKGMPQKFDIVHHLGLLYHLRDPMLSFAQSRMVLNEGGTIVVETAGINDDERSYMAFNGVEPEFHFYGASDTWAPTKACLREMLKRSMFEPIEDSWNYLEGGFAKYSDWKFRVGRLCVMAKAVGEETVHSIERLKIAGFQ